MLGPDGQLLGGRYRLRRQLGSGGMGVVYEAWQEDLGRSVALKLMTGADPEALLRFQREARAAAALGHPHIVQVFDFQTLPGEPPFIVMELVTGSSLRDLVKESGPLGEERAAKIGLQVASALDAAHRVGIVHRDVKPANVLVTSSPTLGEVAKVLDFGIAKDLTSSAPAITQLGGVIGTLAYMSPEQARGEPLDGRTDVYSLASTLFFAVTGQRSLEGSDSESMFGALLEGRARRISTARPGLDPEFCDIIGRGLAAERNARFPSAQAFGEALQRWVDSRARSRELHFGVAAVPMSVPVSVAQPAAPYSVPAHSAMSPASTAAMVPLPPTAKKSPLPLFGIALLALFGVVGIAAAGSAVWYFQTVSDGEPATNRAAATPTATSARVDGAAPGAVEPSAEAAPAPPRSAKVSKTSPLKGKSPAAEPAATATASPAPAATSVQDVPQPKQPACTSGTQCGSQCVNLKWDSQHCGSCDHVCGPGTACQAGSCSACRSPLIPCGGRCIDGSRDSKNCGACGHACPGVCSGGKCL